MASTAAEQVAENVVSGTSKTSPDIKGSIASQINNQNDASPALNPKDFIISVAANIASQPLQNYDSDVWGVLTAISNKARKRRQGINMLLTSDEHCVGRLPGHANFQIESTSISGNHCKIYRKTVIGDGKTNTSCCGASVFLKDTSTNGTFVNWERLKKNSPEARIQHGDIVSFAAPPEHEMSFAFVYREILGSNPMLSSVARKRKPDDLSCESKRLKGIGIGGPDGPISLDDFKSLQRSNTELRKQLEAQVLTIDTLRNESRAIVEHHESETKQIKESIAKSFHNEIIELRNLLDTKQKELVQLNKLSAEQKHSIDDLGQRLSTSLQSLSEANEVIKSQKASIAELKTQLDEERVQRKGDRETASAQLKAAVHRCQIEAQEELRRFADVAMRQEREQQELINKMKDSEKEKSMQVEALMSKLEDTRQKLVETDNRNRQLEAQVSEEQLTSANARKKLEERELEIRTLQKDLESEKAAREEAWAKVSALELEISSAVRDLDVERQRHRGARERIMLRETQLRAFYSTTEEISSLFAKQQEQLKSMQRTLEDEENFDNTSLDIDLNPINRNPNRTNTQEDERATCNTNCATNVSSSTSGQRSNRNEVCDTSCEDVDATEKHDCEIISQEGQNTQEPEYTSSVCVAKGAFGSDIEGVVGRAPILETDLVETEQVNETESPGIGYERNESMRKSVILAGDTMQLDCETQPHEINQNDGTVPLNNLLDLNNPLDDGRDIEDTEGVETIRTADLIASEVAGSWACSTAPSVHGENETQRSKEDDESHTQKIKEVTIIHDPAAQVGESQTKPTTCEVLIPRRNDTELGVGDQGNVKHATGSDSETESCSDTDDDHGKEKHSTVSDSDTEGSDDNRVHSFNPNTEGIHEANRDQKQIDTMDEDD